MLQLHGYNGSDFKIFKLSLNSECPSTVCRLNVGMTTVKKMDSLTSDIIR